MSKESLLRQYKENERILVGLPKGSPSRNKIEIESKRIFNQLKESELEVPTILTKKLRLKIDPLPHPPAKIRYEDNTGEMVERDVNKDDVINKINVLIRAVNDLRFEK